MVRLEESKNGLYVILEDKEELEDMFHKQENGKGLICVSDILESARYIGNGWLELAPEQIGALTDAPMIGKDIDIDDDGNVEIHEDSKVYWYTNYQIEDPFEVLLKKGKVFFHLAI